MTLKVTPLKTENLSYSFYDNGGKMMFNGQILNENTEIFLDHLSPSLYYLQVTANQQIVKKITIIKQP
ncbi:MAG: T9SS type A sorting domain-containing protein [Bacteroidales bacterium]|nr:T9SS type A sorting domain-containing protein [Bacteroidales bacterium]